MLELDPPLALYEGWDEFRKLYPSVGSSSSATDDQVLEERLKNVAMALQKLPRVHLYVLDAIVKYLKSYVVGSSAPSVSLTSLCSLLDSTSGKESNEVFVTKLALSVGRSTSFDRWCKLPVDKSSVLAILRPKQETELSIQDRHPTCTRLYLCSFGSQLNLSHQCCSLTCSSIIMNYCLLLS